MCINSPKISTYIIVTPVQDNWFHYLNSFCIFYGRKERICVDLPSAYLWGCAGLPASLFIRRGSVPSVRYSAAQSTTANRLLMAAVQAILFQIAMQMGTTQRIAPKLLERRIMQRSARLRARAAGAAAPRLI